MKEVRSIKNVLQARPTLEGAGVKLRRVFGFSEVPEFDPFLLLDDFHSKNPEDYLAGFPWHPHRGIETVTYMIHGRVDHGDSLGNEGVIHGGDVQWMTAGSGIIHQEMPKDTEGEMWGLQLWVNLPAANKMMPPRYRDISASGIPQVRSESGSLVKVIAGEYKNVQGPVRDIVRSPEYLDIALPPEEDFIHPISREKNVAAYILMGDGVFAPSEARVISKQHLVHFGAGTSIHVRSGQEGLRFVLISGEPLREPVAWSGPIVMNTREELARAFEEYRAGTFIRT